MDSKTRALFAVFLLALVGTSVAIYVRISASHNYVLEYEVPCDSFYESCFIYECEEGTEDGCEPWIYKLAQKNAADVYAACGKEIEGCEMAYECQPDDRLCTFTLCDPEVDECAVYTPQEKPAELWTEEIHE